MQISNKKNVISNKLHTLQNISVVNVNLMIPHNAHNNDTVITHLMYGVNTV